MQEEVTNNISHVCRTKIQLDNYLIKILRLIGL